MKVIYCSVLIGGCLIAPGARATLVDGTGAPLAITTYNFQTGEDGATNPSYSYTGVPGYGSVTISYAAYFDGQSFDMSVPPVESGSPTSPLTLMSAATDWGTVVEVDGSAPVAGTEVLGGVPVGVTGGFIGPISIAFSVPVAGVQLTVGYLDQVGSTSIQGFAADGSSLGSVLNTVAGDGINPATGYETFNLTDNGGQYISGLQITSTEIDGIGINGVGVMRIPMPAPGALALLPGVSGLLLARRRRSRAVAASGRH